MTEHSTSAVTRATYGIAAAGAIFTLGLVVYASEAWRAGLDRWLLVSPFALLAISPYLALWRIARRVRADIVRSRIALAVAVLITAPAVWFYVLGFFVHSDPQSGLLFLFLPVYQFLAGGAAAMILWLIVSGVRRWVVR